MKRAAKIIVGFVIFLFVAILLIPIFFKDRIKALIISEFEKATEATIYFDIDRFGLSMIKNFPDFTVSMAEFGVVGKGIFAGDTLIHVEDLEATMNLNEVLFGDGIAVKGVDLSGPRFLIMQLENGAANYDISKPSEENLGSSSEEESSVKFGINRFSISDGEMVYFNQSSALITQLSGINLKGRGDFDADIFDLITAGKINEVGLMYEGNEYVANKSVELDLVLSMDILKSSYTFKENEFLINQFPLTVDGNFKLLDEGYAMDIDFTSPSTDFKELFSLIPGAYTDSFDDIEATGSVAFKGSVRGIYSESQLPGFGIDLDVKNAKIQYPDLPQSLDNIQLSMNVNNSSGIIEETSIDIQNMHVDFGNNPFNASLKLLNLRDYPIESKINGQLNLADLNKMLPVEDFDLAGQLTIDASAKGRYDSLKNTVPLFDVSIYLEDGMVKSADLPAPIEDISIRTQLINKSSQMADSKVIVEQFKMSMDNQPFEAMATIVNPENPEWEISGKGALDLEKIMMLYPVEGVSIRGSILADIKSMGSMADVEAKRYRNLPTSGKIVIEDFIYEDETMEQSYEINSATTSFSPRSVEVEGFTGKAGQTSYTLNGSISNYLGFALNDEKLSGNLDVDADVLNINEWMTSTTESDDVVAESEPYEVIRIPENVSLILDAGIDQVIYSDLAMNDISGKFIVKDGVLDLNRAKFKALNGTVGMNGKYDSRPKKPSFDFGLDVKNISIPSAFKSVSIVKKMAPVTESMTGSFDTDFSISGLLTEAMMPDYTSITGQGIIQVLKASLGQSGIISELGSVSKLANFSTASLEKVKMMAEIREGRLFVKPFKLKLGDYETEIEGSTGIDGSVDYSLGIDVPAGQIGAQLNGLLASLTNNNDITGSDIKLDLGLAGSYADPKVSLIGIRSSDGSNVSSAVSATVKAKVEEKKEEVTEEVEEKVKEVKDSATQVIDQKVDQLKDSANVVVNSQLDSAASKLSEKIGLPKDSLSKELQNTKKKAEDVLKGLFKKKKKKKKGTGGHIQ